MKQSEFIRCLITHIDGLVQGCSNCIANVLELLQSCTKPSIYYHVIIPGGQPWLYGCVMKSSLSDMRRTRGRLFCMVSMFEVIYNLISLYIMVIYIRLGRVKVTKREIMSGVSDIDKSFPRESLDYFYTKQHNHVAKVIIFLQWMSHMTKW